MEVKQRKRSRESGRLAPSAKVLRTRDAAEYVGIGESTLTNLRVSGGGPRFIKLGKTVLYDVRDLDKWMNANKFKTTAEAKNA
jgi:excisionase family DNA binding protein